MFRLNWLEPLALVLFLFLFCAAIASAKTQEEWVLDIKAEHLLTNQGTARPDSPTGYLGLLLHGSQHCKTGKRAVLFDKANYTAALGCWSPASGTHSFNIATDDATPATTAAFNGAGGEQLVILQAAPDDCKSGNKILLTDKITLQVLEGCWKPGSEPWSYDVQWDDDAKQTIGPILPQFFLIGGPEKNKNVMPDGTYPTGPQIEG